MTANLPALLPFPRHLELGGKAQELPESGYIVVRAERAADYLFTAQRLQQVAGRSGARWMVTADAGGDPKQNAAQLRVDPAEVAQDQGYRLTVDDAAIDLVAHDGPGLFYGVATLAQLLHQYGRNVPALKIDDWPDFAARGVMLDISRNKVPTQETLYQLVDLLASWKVNEFQLYTEHTFAYRNHPTVWESASPLTGEEILQLDAYCRQRFIDLVPNQNSFGHMHHWLQLPEYAHLAETHETFQTPWGSHHGPFSLTPVEPGSLALLSGLYDELLPHFTSPWFNVGCDETWDLGQGRSKDLCAERGKDRVYLDFVKEIHKLVTNHGRRMQFWGDIIIGSPNLVSDLPTDAMALEWGYEYDHPFAAHSAEFAKSGIPFYVCPGTSSWNSLLGRTDNAIGNLRSAAENGSKHGALGYLSTDWGDNGHWQPLPVSYLGFAYGSAYSWCLVANQDRELTPALSLHAFGDASGAMGHIVYELGNVYKLASSRIPNSSALFWILQLPVDQIGRLGPQVTSAASFKQAADNIRENLARLDHAHLHVPDAQLIKDEFKLMGALALHACHLGQVKLGRPDGLADAATLTELHQELEHILPEFSRIWLARNRPGGLSDSQVKLDQRLAEYRAS